MITKFRAWNIESQCMLNHDFIVNTVIHNDAIVRDFSDILEHDDMFVLMQSTGLKDKNGKEIFEGDIVNIHWFYKGDGGEYEAELNNVVIYHDSTDEFNAPYFFVVDKDEVVPLSAILMHEESIEVIGNVYEHPGLLEGDGE